MKNFSKVNNIMKTAVLREREFLVENVFENSKSVLL